MQRTATLRKQHDAIALLAGELNAAMESIEARADAERISRLLLRFDAILTAHLSSEDNFLYPAMRASKNGITAETAGRFSREMGGLVEVYAAFAERWRNASAIFDSPNKFRSEWGKLFAALAARIERENGELYPLADAMDRPEDRTAA